MTIPDPDRLTRLLFPRSVAFVGGRDAAEAARVCRRFGFGGEIWPVSLTRDRMDGIPCFAGLDALPGVPDAVFVGVNRVRTVSLVKDLAAMGAGGVVCYASGFREVEDGGDALEDRLVAAAGAMPMLGPNCYGLINGLTGACLWPGEHGAARARTGVAIISQSTNMVISMTMQRRGLPIAFVATVGNQAQTGLSMVARALVEDDRITAVGLYIEAVDDGIGFEALAERSRTLGKPIVVLKSGRTEGARQALAGHTASIAGSDDAAAAFFTRLGMARVDSMTAFLEALKLAHVHGALGGNRITAVCCSGGEAAMLSDTAPKHGVRFPGLDAGCQERLLATLNNLVNIANPLDYHTFIWANREQMTETFSAAFRAPADFAFLTLDWVRTDRCLDRDWLPAIEAVEAASARARGKTGVLATLPENMPETIAERLIAAGIVPLCGIDDGLAAVGAMARVGARWRDPAPAPTLRPATRTEAAATLLDEADAKARLAAAGVPTPPGRAAVLADVAIAARALGGPVAVKALGVAHKTEQRAVATHVAPDNAQAVAAEMADRLAADLFLVEAMVTDPVLELILAVSPQPPYGLMLTIGAGGVTAELLGHARHLMLPASDADIATALDSLPEAPILAGYRGRPGADRGAAIALIAAFARFAQDHADSLAEAEINPAILTPAGAVAADALIRLEECP